MFIFAKQPKVSLIDVIINQRPFFQICKFFQAAFVPALVILYRSDASFCDTIQFPRGMWLRFTLHPTIVSGREAWVQFLLKLEYLDQYQYLGNCPPAPPLTQQQSIDNNLGLMLG